MSHQDVRGSQLTGAQVNGSTGNQVGTISDVIINPASGRVDFAVLSVNSSAGNDSSGINSSTSSSSTAASSTGAGGKQVVVPWMLLRPSSSSASSGTSAQQSFQFAGDNSKLDSAPSFDVNTDLSQPSWRQSVYSYFGLSGRGSIGAAESQGSTYGGRSSSAPESSGSSSSPGSSSSGSSTDNSSSGSSSSQRQ
jgi:sporulation protein YlmC with PRC-barrel domain